MSAPIAPRTRTAEALLLCRRCAYCGVLIVCVWTFAHALLIEEYQVPTGSMAPTVRGIHRTCTCPRCGQEVVIGRHFADYPPHPPLGKGGRPGGGHHRFYRNAFCPNCGFAPLDLANTDEIDGDRVLVNKAAYLVRTPARWEIVVLRLFGIHYIKRLLGLPGEEVSIHDGDLYVNGLLCRKTAAEAKRMRVLIFDQDHVPQSGKPIKRWHYDPQGMCGNCLSVDGTATPATLTYQNVSFETGKCEPLRDEYAYNAGLHADSECVHDFMIETEVEVTTGVGSLSFRLCDGQDWVEVRLPVGSTQPSEVFAWPMAEPDQKRKLADPMSKQTLRAGQRYRVEMSLVDRRLSLAIDGQLWRQFDLPEAKGRDGVTRPFQVHADGVCATLHSFRLYRDIHYGQQGTHAVHGKSVRLGVDQYFLLGDNSPQSEDSRHWPDEGRVSAADLIGPLMWNRLRGGR